ncbi:protein kinase [Acidobacteria bacterium AH-259-O06]|nr:protein kinase [Acidobacteria bacterium AH-259-O06]
MSLASGTRLGPYEIITLLGAGGMGEVYRARDTRLDRTVAIKVLPSHLSDNPGLRQRFEREARTISRLNHPHICTLYDIGHHQGIDFLVMEYLEGKTLADRLAKGALPIDQALRYAVEIADALDKAHRQGVVHRDLKPGNIMLTETGAKLLDFGLAKLRPPPAAAASLSALPTEEASLTAEGTILGTFQYMAPEQLEGKEADARTDIFAFGALLYEMATGRKAFEGKSQASLIAAILERHPPPISTLQPLTPPALDHAVRRCLAKEPDERWQSANDLTGELKWIVEAGSQAGLPAPVLARRRSRQRLGWIAAGALCLPLIATLSLSVIHLREVPQEAHPMRFFVSPPEQVTLARFPVISPDGKHLVFETRSADSPNLLWVRSLDSLTARSLPGTEGALYPFWSPDSRFIGFFSRGKLKKVPLSGGPPQTLCDAPAGRGGSWNRDGTIVFNPHWADPLQYVSAAGGEAKPLTELDESRGETAHRWPGFLPDGRHFFYLALSSQPENRGIYLASLDSKETKRLLSATLNAAYAEPGYLLFMRESTLMAQPFDKQGLELTGEAFPLAQNVDRTEHTYTTAASFSVSENGVLTYRSGSSLSRNQLVWFDREGKRLGPVGEPADYSNHALSPDGKRVAVGLRDPETQTRDIWLFDLARATSSRLTFDPADDLNPVWSPDGTRIAFTSDRKGPRDIYQKMASGTGQDELVLESGEQKSLTDWSADGRFLLYNAPNPQTRGDVWMLPLSEEGKPTPFLQQSFDQREAQFSPDGRWVTYYSNESGTRQVYVQPFPATGGKWQISTQGGVEPRWRRDGKELFYIAGSNLMAVEVNTRGSSLEAGIPKVLFEASFAGLGTRNSYVVSADGRRFLIITPVEQAASSPITVVLNWTTELAK